MQATVGDHILVMGNRVGQPQREGEVLEARGPDGTAPYVVRWADGHEGLFFPGPGVSIEHRES
jgi:hypothetical protein